MVLGITGSSPVVRLPSLFGYWLFLDNIFILFILFTNLFIFSLILGRHDLGRSISTGRAAANFKVSTINLNYNYYQLNLIILYYVFFTLSLGIINFLYTYAPLTMYTLYQIQFNNVGWFFIVFIYMFSFIILYLLIQRLPFIYWTMELTIIITMLITILFFYMLLNNLFILIFFLEAQGILFIYLAISSQAGSRNGQLRNIDINLKQWHLWILNSLFAQFWASFMGVILLIYVAARLSFLYGSLSWVDINYLYLFSTVTIYSYLKYSNLILLILLTTGLWIKLGLFPYYFWKPELYKDITWESLLWYASIYSFAFIFLFTTIFNYYLYMWHINLYIIFWIILLCGFSLLPGVLFTINEIRIFIVYMSIFHVFFIIAGLISNSYFGATCSLTYICIYTVIVIFFFCNIFLFNSTTFKYLSDLSVFYNYSVLTFSIMCSLASMGGVPPLLGFWAKISVINVLLINAEFVLAFLALSCGLFLLYYYLQNYRFLSNINFNFSYKTYMLTAGSGLLSLVCMITLLNLFSIFFIYDIWNIFILLNELIILMGC